MSTEQNTDPFRKHSFWLQLAVLGAGLAGLWLSQRSAAWHDDGSTRDALAQSSALVAVSFALIARSTYVIVTAALSDAYRVFRSRHLLACTAVLLAAAVALTGSLVMRGPLGELLAHGYITGSDIADVATGAAAIVCGVGAVVAVMGAWDAAREERHWHRSLHFHLRRGI